MADVKTETQHTAGPWREGPTEGIGQRGKLIVVDASGLKVANCEADRLGNGLKFARPLAEDTANARLIAASPTLLTALRDLCDAIPDTTLADDPPLRAWVDAALAAIALAEGR